MKTVKLNKNEIKKILRFIESKAGNTVVEINVDNSGVGTRVVMKVEKEAQEYDVTDYIDRKSDV